MANLNKWTGIGRFTRDPEAKTFGSGGKVVRFGFAVNERKKNPDTQQWEDSPVFVDCEAFNSGEKFKLADIIEQYCKKGSQVYIEGRLSLDQWEDKNSGTKRTKLKVIVNEVQLLDKKEESQQQKPKAQRTTVEHNDFGEDADGNIPF